MRDVAAQVLERHLQAKQMTCPMGHRLQSTTLVRHLCCDGPICGGKTGEQALALGQCQECEFNLCLRYIS